MITSRKSRYVYNPLLEEDKLAAELEKQGKHVIKLNAGDPTAYFKTPGYIIRAFVEALKEGKTAYANAAGVKELREAIAERYWRMYRLSISPESIVVTQGVSEAIDFINAILLNPGDAAILFRPYYPLYPLYLLENGGKPIFENYYESLSWNIDTEKLEKTIKKNARKRPKYMLITNPNNPTGTVLDRKVLEEIVELANNYGIMLISDEIYDEIVFSNAKFTSVSEIAKGVPYAIFNGASKAYDATGFRLGYVLVPEHDEKSEQLLAKLVDYAQARLSASTPAQYAFAKALVNSKEHEKQVRSMVKEIEERVRLATKLVNKSAYMHTIEPQAAFYLFPKVNLKQLGFKNDKEFTESLLKEEYVQLSRGSGFGAEGYVRIVGLAQKDILSLAINKIIEFCERHAREA
ncbi:MAG: pyridoxal phosphate-dependent aminotransferase [Candidatus Micrarchaeia archaeon]|jgi:alanine-synthesizing transaminase